MRQLREIVEEHAALVEEPLAALLIPVVFSPTGTSTGGYPFLGQKSYETLRDTVPHILGMGQRTIESLALLRATVDGLNPKRVSEENRGHFDRACKVVRTVVNTASVTAPPDLWLLRQVLGTLPSTGLMDRLLGGEIIEIDSSIPVRTHQGVSILTEELVIDLNFLLARGYIDQISQTSFRMKRSDQIQDVFERINPVTETLPNDLGAQWGQFFSGTPIDSDTRDALYLACMNPVARTEIQQDNWFATFDEIELGFQMLPIVLGLRVAGFSEKIGRGDTIQLPTLRPDDPELAAAAMNVLMTAGTLKINDEKEIQATTVGRRVFSRGPGPFGIIEAYHGYMRQLPQILVHGRGKAWVQRSANIAASQDANRKTFDTANNSLDRFIDDYGFELKIFVEHAVGRGEATRQRWERSGDTNIHYFGADLEDAAIDAARVEQDRGTLPASMKFIRNADIASPEVVVNRLREEGLDPHGTVMLVGNGFHEARNQEDDAMIKVFRGYHEAGIILLFTEESALSVDDLLSTAWNTYHAGFKYVHERSGQGLRPARQVPYSRLGRPLPASWNECATRAGYVRAEALCSRTRTIYPYRPRNDHNPAISVNHFFVPRAIAEELGMPFARS